MSERQIRRARERQAERKGAHQRRVGRKAALATGAALGVVAAFAPAAQADTIEVTSLEDDGTGTTLREAVDEANGNGEPDTVVFQAGLSGTIELENTDIEISNEALEIQGPGAAVITVDAAGGGGPDDRVFDLYGFNDPDLQVSISGLTLIGGDVSNDGGAIRSRELTGDAAELTIANSVITDNYASNDGGGVYVDEGSLTIVNSLISDNDADSEGGGVSVYNTDGDQATEVLISQSVFSGNESFDDEGGGIYVDSGDAGVLIERSTFFDNTSFNEGGGGEINYTDGPVTLDSVTVADNTVTDDEDNAGGFDLDLYDAPGVVRNSTFSGNLADDGEGGGLHLGVDGGDDSSWLVENSTFSGNEAGHDGGGIYVGDLYADSETAPATIRNSTIVNNLAGTGGDGGGGGVYVYDDNYDPENNGPVVLSSTIVANNTADFGNDLGQDEFADGFDVDFSLVEDPSDAEVDDAGGNIFGLDPQLGPLQNNGGPTQTHAPALTSPVLDAGIGNGLTTDQRGLARTADLALVANRPGSDGTDIGSVEIQTADCQGQAGALKLDGTAGNDTITGSEGPDTIAGLAGDDTLDGAGANDCVSGDDGSDAAQGGSGNDLVTGGAGNDSAKGGPGKDVAQGDAGRDNAKGGGGKDIVKGGAGKDKASGGGGKDKVKGNAGRDRLKGGGKADRLSGAGGKDNLKGGGGKDRLKGGPGKDKLVGGGGKDRFNCGGGNDKVTAQPKDKVSANCEKVVEPG